MENKESENTTAAAVESDNTAEVPADEKEESAAAESENTAADATLQEPETGSGNADTDAAGSEDYDIDDFDDFTQDTVPKSDGNDVSEDSGDAAPAAAEPDVEKTSKLKDFGASVKTKAANAGAKIKSLPWKLIGIISGSVAGVCAAIYLGGALFYNSHFYWGTALGSFDCSNLTPEKAEEKIRQELDVYTFTLRERGDKTETIDGKSIDFKCLSVSGIDKALERQNPFKWPFDKAARFQNIDVKVDFDADKLYHEAEKLDCFAQSIKDMDGAYAGVYYEDRAYHMREVEDKNAISFERLYSALLAGITNTYKDMSLEEEGIYVLMADEDNMRHALENLNKYVSTTITYTRGSETFELNADTICAWLSINPDCTITLSDEGIAEYVNALSGLYNTIGTERKFKTSYGESITVSGGDYGWQIDKAGEAAALKEDILNGNVLSRTPVCKHKAFGEVSGTGDISNTFVEVSIAAQTLWFYKNGELIVSSPVVTGNPLKGNATHKGIYSLKYKERNAVLRGDNYETPVSFWMPFNGGEGLHDATWRGVFGGQIYRGGGSHGCVNLPYKTAQTIFGTIEPGTPVIVY